MEKYTGVFDAHHEQGMGGCCTTFHDDRGLRKVEGNPHTQWSMEWLIWFNDFYTSKTPLRATIYKKDSTKFYEGPLTVKATKYLRKKVWKGEMDKDEFFTKCRLLDYYFKELGFDKSCEVVHLGYRAEIDTPYKVEALVISDEGKKKTKKINKENNNGQEKEVSL